MSVSDLMRQIAELSLPVQDLERTERDQQDKIGKLREAWDELWAKSLSRVMCQTEWRAVERAVQDLEK